MISAPPKHTLVKSIIALSLLAVRRELHWKWRGPLFDTRTRRSIFYRLFCSGNPHICINLLNTITLKNAGRSPLLVVDFWQVIKLVCSTDISIVVSWVGRALHWKWRICRFDARTRRFLFCAHHSSSCVGRFVFVVCAPLFPFCRDYDRI